MNYVVLTIIVMILSGAYEKSGKHKVVAFVCLLAICFALCSFAGARTRYNDTIGYLHEFVAISDTTPFPSIDMQEFAVSNVYFFRWWNWLIHKMTDNVNIYFGLSSAVFVLPSIYLMHKYAQYFSLSVLLFMTLGLYLFSLAGLKQSMAAGFIMLGIDQYIEKKYIRYYILSILAMGFHTYAGICLVIPLLGRELWNIRTKVFCIGILGAGILLSRFGGTVSSLIELLGKDVSEKTLTAGSVNIYRALGHVIPFVFSIIAAKRLKDVNDEGLKIMIKIGILTSLFMILARFGNPILFGRMPYYFMIGEIICVPYLIYQVFNKRDRALVNLVAISCYCAFGIYSLYLDGAFQKDIFRLIWFNS